MNMLQESFDIYSRKPLGLETQVFFVNEGDETLSWAVQIVGMSVGHKWMVQPASGNLSTCETGNFSVRLDASNVSAFEDHTLRLKVASSSYPFAISSDYSVYSPINTSVDVSFKYFLEAKANATLSYVPAQNGSTGPLKGKAGQYLEATVRPVDVDGLRIRGSGSDLFDASLRRSDQAPGTGHRTICTVDFDATLDEHRILCVLDPFESGSFSLDVTLDDQPVRGSPYDVVIECPSGFEAINRT